MCQNLNLTCQNVGEWSAKMKRCLAIDWNVSLNFTTERAESVSWPFVQTCTLRAPSAAKGLLILFYSCTTRNRVKTDHKVISFDFPSSSRIQSRRHVIASIVNIFVWFIHKIYGESGIEQYLARYSKWAFHSHWGISNSRDANAGNGWNGCTYARECAVLKLPTAEKCKNIAAGAYDPLRTCPASKSLHDFSAWSYELTYWISHYFRASKEHLQWRTVEADFVEVSRCWRHFLRRYCAQDSFLYGLYLYGEYLLWGGSIILLVSKKLLT